MRKTSLKTQYVAFVAALFVAILFVGSSAAWYFTATRLDMGSVSGGVSYLANYFESGNGSAEQPYEIAKPDQLYNLAWLQYLGAFNQTSEPDFTPFHFYISDKYSGTLDMTGFVLPPIGTQTYPFIGYLDGRGNTVANLTVANVTTQDASEAARIFDLPQNVKYLEGTNVSGVEIIGFMGVVGPLTGSGTYASAANALKDLTIQNITVNTETDSALIGLAAGYVNGPVSNVAVVGGTVKIKSGTGAVDASAYTANLSDYGIVGYATEAYRGQIDAVNVEIAEKERQETTYIKEEDGNTWGGSIDMYSLHGRLANIFDAADPGSNYVTTPTYVTAETVTIDKVNGTTTTVTTGSQAVYANRGNNENYYYYYYDSPRGGSFNFGQDSKTDQPDGNVYYHYICLYGESARYPKTVTTMLYDDQFYTAYYIKDQQTYLVASTSATNGITNGNSQTDYGRWAFDGDGYLFTIIDGVRYYLGIANDGIKAAVTTNRSVTWTKNAEDALVANVGGTDYYLYFDGSTWLVTSHATYYRIFDGSNYLTATSNTAVGNSVSTTGLSKWYLSGTGSNQYVFTVRNGQVYYLIHTNNSLALSTSTTNAGWTIENGEGNQKKIYYDSGNSANFLTFQNGSWGLVSEIVKHFISDGSGHFLSLDGNGNIINTDVQNATGWEFSSGSMASGTISTSVNGTRYYLGYANGGLTASNTSATWTYDNGNWYCVDGNDNRQYLAYDNGWTTKQAAFAGYTISYSNNNGTYYLNANGNNDGVTTTGTPTVWMAISSGSGYKFAYDNGNSRYYLRHPSNSLGIGTGNSNNVWTYTAGSNGATLSYTASSWFQTNTYYLKYNDSWTIATGNNNNVLTIAPYYASPEGVIVLELDVSDVSHTVNTQEVADTFANASESTTMQNIVKTVETKPSGNPTYFPLKAQNTAPFNVLNENTGYVVSGARATMQHIYGDIRVSWFPMSSISASLGGNTNYSSSRLQVLTRTVNSGGVVRIADSYNNGTAAAGTALNGISYRTIEQLGLTKYEDARDNLEDVLAPNGTAAPRIYGLHFMDAVINKDYTVVAPVAVLNGDEYSNYELPQDSIDFTLKDKGKINFFAGSYYSTTVNKQTVRNNSFFSLYEIERNYGETENPIRTIREIYKVYGDPNDDSKPYKYTYNATDTISDAGYELMFDLSWIKSQTLVDDAVYYYEIPVNSGEYALGSVENAYGAYLIYLDISANKQEVERKIYTETITTTTDTYEYPEGVAITTGNEAVDASQSLTVKLGTGNSGTTAISKSGTAFTYGQGTATYIPDGTSANGVSGVGGIPVRTVQSIVERITFVDYNTTTKTTDTIITTTTVDIDENGNQSTPVIVRTINGVETDDRTWYETHDITSGAALAKLQYLPGDATVNLNFAFTPRTVGGDYAVSATSTAALRIYGWLYDNNYTMQVNGTFIAATKTTVNVTATRAMTLSTTKGGRKLTAGLSGEKQTVDTKGETGDLVKPVEESTKTTKNQVMVQSAYVPPICYVDHNTGITVYFIYNAGKVAGYYVIDCDTGERVDLSVDENGKPVLPLPKQDPLEEEQVSEQTEEKPVESELQPNEFDDGQPEESDDFQIRYDEEKDLYEFYYFPLGADQPILITYDEASGQFSYLDVQTDQLQMPIEGVTIVSQKSEVAGQNEIWVISDSGEQMELTYEPEWNAFRLKAVTDTEDVTEENPEDDSEEAQEDGTDENPEEGSEEAQEDGADKNPEDDSEEAQEDGTDENPEDDSEETQEDSAEENSENDTEETTEDNTEETPVEAGIEEAKPEEVFEIPDQEQKDSEQSEELQEISVDNESPDELD